MRSPFGNVRFGSEPDTYPGDSPGFFEVLTVLGKAESLARLKDQAGVVAAA